MHVISIKLKNKYKIIIINKGKYFSVIIIACFYYRISFRITHILHIFDDVTSRAVDDVTIKLWIVFRYPCLSTLAQVGTGWIHILIPCDPKSTPLYTSLFFLHPSIKCVRSFIVEVLIIYSEWVIKLIAMNRID